MDGAGPALADAEPVPEFTGVHLDPAVARLPSGATDARLAEVESQDLDVGRAALAL
ncbi:hypothetical protein WME97_12820 [Sorangium sp. So ce367]|uniref:hypothetical protein n=1 Tax=Sorangium sp. So ce367 TaxID=3133305 RepID=UPI003F5F6E79